MGYQESYVRLKNAKKFDKLVEITRGLGEDFFENHSLCRPVEIITLLKSIEGTLEWMCEPNKKYSFGVGERFIYFTGERSGQRDGSSMYGTKCPNGLEIYATECFPSEEIFNVNSGYAIHEEWNWEYQ